MLAIPTVENLIQSHLAGRRPNVVGFVDRLLHLAHAEGKVRCTLAGEHGLRLEIGGGQAFDVPLDFALGKLRAMCARLGVLCQESGHDVSLYGGEGIVEKETSSEVDGHRGRWHIRFTNTTDKQEFDIELAPRESGVASKT